jgi:hypothetical protein
VVFKHAIATIEPVDEPKGFTIEIKCGDGDPGKGGRIK